MVQVSDVELEAGSQVRTGLRSRVAEPRDYREWWVSDFFGNCTGITNQLGIAVVPSHSRLESTRDHMAASGGGPRDRDLEEGLQQSTAQT